MTKEQALRGQLASQMLECLLVVAGTTQHPTPQSVLQ
uniref:Uncharacterized protein n=1 Tax=Rhizophora mucronata TaxID=61149 RepID=A0A2P2NJZ7_RHIMU